MGAGDPITWQGSFACLPRTNSLSYGPAIIIGFEPAMREDSSVRFLQDFGGFVATIQRFLNISAAFTYLR